MEYDGIEIKEIEKRASFFGEFKDIDDEESSCFCLLCNIEILSDFDFGGVATIIELESDGYNKLYEVEKECLICYSCMKEIEELI